MDPYRDFARSPNPTLGVEWEIGLVDPRSRDLVPRAQDIIDETTARHPELHLEREFLQNTIELVTPVCKNTAEAVGYLAEATEKVREVVEEDNLRLWASGGHPFADFRAQPLSPKLTYQEIINRTQYWGQQMLLWGIHCHIGIRHEERVWPIINAVMTKYAHILAISASSPGWEGLDTGYASNRTMLYQQLPTAGMPYEFHSWQEWVQFMDDQRKSGVISHTGSMHFDVRPAAKWGTVEVRIADATSNLRELAAIVALTHCLVVYYDHKIDNGEELPVLQPWHVAENKWRGARYGMDALVITSRDTEERWVTEELVDLVDELQDVATELDCVRELTLVLEILERGAGYQRQRRLFEVHRDWKPAVDLACDELTSMDWQ